MFLHLSVSHSVHGGGVPAPGEWGLVLGGGCLLSGGSGPGGVPGPEGCLLPGRGVVHGGDPPETATAAGSTHPTGMHSCFALSSFCKPS